jgi:hypothetical protein
MNPFRFQKLLYVPLGVIALVSTAPAQAPKTQVPKTWDDKELADWATPVVGLNVRPGHFSEREYYQAPVDNLRTYPVYHPDKEPPGYWEDLNKLKPAPLVELDKKRTPDDWVKDGRRVFEELDVVAFRSADPKLIAQVRSKEAMAKARPHKDGTLGNLRWVVTAKGIQLSISECASCHRRLMPDGSFLHGAPGNLFDPSNRVIGEFIGTLIDAALSEFFKGDALGTALYRQFGVPWLKDDPHERLKTMPEAEVGALFETHINGVFARFNGSPFYPTKFPDLIGLRTRKYLDHTGTHQHRGAADLMRYAALVTSSDSADFGPHSLLSDKQRRIDYRHPDELLYALAEYIYSLQPPPNPHKFDDQAKAGEAIFKREDCARCHSGADYTNNRLTPALGFKPPREHRKMLSILDESAGTDPDLALRTRKGTGYYKVPSLRDLWYRGLYLHDGSLANLEDLFDPKRLRDDYEPTGFKGYHFTKEGKGEPVKQRAIRGHEYGMELTPEERAQLVAFLRTL